MLQTINVEVLLFIYMNQKVHKGNINNLTAKETLHLLITSRIFCLLYQGCAFICNMLRTNITQSELNIMVQRNKMSELKKKRGTLQGKLLPF